MAGEDLTLRIGGEAQGAAQAARETGQAIQNLAQQAGAAGTPLAQTGQAAAGAGEGFKVTRGEAARLATTLLQLGVVPPQLTASLQYLLWHGLTPTVAGFAAAIFVVQGVIAVFRSLHEATEKETKRMQELVESTQKAVAALDEIQHLKGPLSAEKAAELRQKQLALQTAGLSEEEATGALKVLEKRAPDLTAHEAAQYGYAWVGRTEEAVGPKAFGDVGVFTRRMIGDKTLRGTLAERGGPAVMELPGPRQNAERGMARMMAEANLSVEERIAQEYASVFGVSIEDARAEMRIATNRMGAWEAVRAGPLTAGTIAGYSHRVKTVAGILGLRRAITDADTGRINIIHNYGTVLNLSLGTEPRDAAASGPVRGPSE